MLIVGLNSMFASDLTYAGLLARGLTGLLVPALLSGLCYFAADRTARGLESSPGKVYAVRLAIMAGAVVLWWACYALLFSSATVGKQQFASFWYAVALREGMVYGAHSIWAWCAVALIDWPKMPTDNTDGPTRRSTE